LEDVGGVVDAEGFVSDLATHCRDGRFFEIFRPEDRAFNDGTVGQDEQIVDGIAYFCLKV
jgi:hypothetical protein